MTDQTNLQPVTDQQKRVANGLLFISALIWGSGFIPQKICADTISPFAFNGIRYTLAAIMVLAIARFQLPKDKKGRIITLIAGLNLFVAATLQQVGMTYTTVGNASFITTIYIAFVPFLGFLLFRKKIAKNAYIAAGIAVIGLYLLTTSGRALDQISIGDGIVFIGSIFWALHILVVDIATNHIDAIQFSSGQFFICASLNLLCWVIFHHANSTGILQTSWLILYSGLIVIGGGFTLQALGQRHATESQAAIILGLEAVFGSLFGMLIFKEAFTPIQFAGAVLIFSSVIIATRK